VTAHALLQEEDGTGRCQPHRQGNRQQDRNQQRQGLLPKVLTGLESAETIEDK
jgi:hypothetical protein